MFDKLIAFPLRGAIVLGSAGVGDPVFEAAGGGQTWAEIHPKVGP